MLWTEEEAKTKWCPNSLFKFSATSDATACNREAGPGAAQTAWVREGTRCIGSECMAWRGESEKDKRIRHQYAENIVRKRTGKPVSEITNADKNEVSPPRGYCGAFGKPEA